MHGLNPMIANHFGPISKNPLILITKKKIQNDCLCHITKYVFSCLEALMECKSVNQSIQVW